jgi:hypothetical protein
VEKILRYTDKQESFQFRETITLNKKAAVGFKTAGICYLLPIEKKILRNRDKQDLFQFRETITLKKQRAIKTVGVHCLTAYSTDNS